MNSLENQIKELNISLLQLQRSALLDTQTILQLMLDKNMCSVDDILAARNKVSSESRDIERIDKAIVSAGGSPLSVPDPDDSVLLNDPKHQLKELHKLLQQLTDNSNSKTLFK